MKTQMTHCLAGLLLMGSVSVMAATTYENNQTDTSNSGTSNSSNAQTPTTQQQKRTDQMGNSTRQNSQRSSAAGNRNDMYKQMDKNNDGVISKEEYMNHHESTYGKFKQNENRSGVNLNDMHNYHSESAEDGGLEGKTRRNLDGAIK